MSPERSGRRYIIYIDWPVVRRPYLPNTVSLGRTAYENWFHHELAPLYFAE